MPRFAVMSAFLKEDWHSRRLLEVCRTRGEAEAFRPDELGLGDAGPTIRGRDARAFDAWLLPRALGTDGDADFQLTAYQAIADAGAIVANPVAALLEAEDKPRTSWRLVQAGVPTPPFACVQTLAEARAAVERLGVVMVKPPYGSLGLGIERLSAAEVGRLAALLREHGVLYLQQWVRCRGRRRRVRDLRLFVVGDEVRAAMERIAPDGEWRTNVFLGGEVRAHRPTSLCAAIAVRATKAVGLLYGGVDVLETEDGYKVIEVNGAPGWDALEDTTGHDMAQAIVDDVIALHRQKEKSWRRRRPRRAA